jgi:hypothetical protein
MLIGAGGDFVLAPGRLLVYPGKALITERLTVTTASPDNSCLRRTFDRV